MKNNPYTLDSTVRLVIRLLIIVGLFLLVKNLSGVLLPFVIGWFIAYLMYPLVCFIQNKMRVKSRIISIVLALVFVFGIIIGGCVLILPVVFNEFAKILPMLISYLEDIGNYPFVNDVILKNLQQYFVDFDYEQLLSLETLNAIIGKILPQFWGLISSVWQFLLTLVTLFIILLYLVFILNEYEKLNENIIKLFPVKYRRFASELQNELSLAMNQYFRGQSLICLITAVLYSIGFSIIGLPMAIVMGILIGVLSIVPYLHSFGFIPVIFFAFVHSVETGGSLFLMLLGVLIVFVIIQGSTDAFFVPRIMGQRLGLSPAIILLSLSVFGALFGFLGLIIALPVTTITLSYYKRFVIGNEVIYDNV